MALLNKDQLKIIATICSKLNIDKESKGVMVAGFSGNRCTSSTELSFYEAIAMIKHLQDIQGHGIFNKCAAMIASMLGMAREMGWTKINAVGKMVGDFKRLDEWVVKYGCQNPKKINDYLYEEMPNLVSQFKIVYNKFLHKI